jgi:putative spermidine/putrescine transport system ATP-binding protein
VRLDGGGEVWALAVNPVAERTMLSIRPERVVIDPPPDLGFNRFAAQIEELMFLGDHQRLRLSLAGLDNFVVKLPAGHSNKSIKVGATVMVGWLSGDCRALDP